MPSSSSEKPQHNGFVTGEWTISPDRNLLVHGNEQAGVEPRLMDVLVHLTEHAGEVVSKQALVDSVWDGRWVTDDVLTVTIYALRKVLGDDARRPRYIETVSRRGYRWIAPVASAAPESVPTQSDGPFEAATVWRRRMPWRAAATLALALCVAGAASILKLPGRRRHVPPAEAHEAYVKGRYFLD